MSYWAVRRVVLDTSVVFSAFRSRRGASAVLLRLLALGELAAVATPSLLLEYEDVLKRPEHLRLSGLSTSGVDAALEELAALVEPVDVYFHWRPQLQDPADEHVLEAAINGRADTLVTFNVRDFANAAPRFGLRVMTAGDLLRELEP